MFIHSQPECREALMMLAFIPGFGIGSKAEIETAVEDWGLILWGKQHAWMLFYDAVWRLGVQDAHRW